MFMVNSPALFRPWRQTGSSCRCARARRHVKCAAHRERWHTARRRGAGSVHLYCAAKITSFRCAALISVKSMRRGTHVSHSRSKHVGFVAAPSGYSEYDTECVTSTCEPEQELNIAHQRAHTAPASRRSPVATRPNLAAPANRLCPWLRVCAAASRARRLRKRQLQGNPRCICHAIQIPI
jgi:hypothetical protein